MKLYGDGLGNKINVPTPRELIDHCNKFVIGQDEAKRVIATQLYMHYKKFILRTRSSKNIVDKSNMLLIGPTGCGKTHIIKTMARKINVPCVIGDATNLTEAGYVGCDVETLLAGLLERSKNDIEKAQKGIVVIDEIDKLATRSRSVLSNVTRGDVGRDGVQVSLLKMLEGSVCGVPTSTTRIHPERPLLPMDTSNILFIGVGAFPDIEGIVNRRYNKRTIGFDTDENIANMENFNPYDHVSQEDLIEFGFIPEFVGRFPVITSIAQLKNEDLVKILTEPKGAIINQYKKLFAMDNNELEFEEDALKYIADVAIKLGTGARALRSIVDNVLGDFICDYADASHCAITITRDIVEEKLASRYSNILKAV